MILRRPGTFAGGIDLPDDKHATLNMSIQPCPLPPMLRVPLAPAGGAAANLIVRHGQRLAAGDLIAKATFAAADVFAPVACTVGSECIVHVAAWDEFVPVPALELLDLEGPFPGPPLAQKEDVDWLAMDAQTLCQRLDEGQILVHRPGGLTLTSWLKLAVDHHCRMLIANAMENQPYVSADHRVMAEHGREVVLGLAILAHAMKAREIILAADQRRVDDYVQIRAGVKQLGVMPIALSPKYPIGTDALLAKVLTGQEVPPGATTMALGVAVIDAATCLAVHRWMSRRQRSAGRVVTVGGELAPACGNFFVPVGTMCSDLIAGPHALVHGGPMIGLHCLPDSVVTFATEAVLALDSPPPAQATPCVRCGWCTDHCPARLNVTDLNDAFELGNLHRAQRLGAIACMECGVCSYVCPSRLPLGQRVKQLKRMLRQSLAAEGGK